MHDGHRERIRQKFFATGLTGLADHEVLELLLTFSIPRKDVNPLAHQLVAHFGSLRAVLDASPAEIKRVPGCGESTAALVSLVRALARRIEAPDIKATKLTTPAAAGLYLRALLRGVKHECVYTLYLSSNYYLLGECRIFEGTIDQTTVYPRRIVEQALQQGAAHVIVAHNHPGGGLKAGPSDLHVTQHIQAALQAVDIHLIEHYIVSESGIYGILSGETATPTPADASREHTTLPAAAEDSGE